MTHDLHIRELPAPDPIGQGVLDIAVAPDGMSYAACVGKTLTVARWSDGSTIETLDAPTPIEALSFSPRGDRLAYACRDGAIHFLALNGNAKQDSLGSELGGYYELAWSADGAYLAASHYEPLVSLFDLADSRTERVLDPEIFSDEGRTAVAFSPDSTRLVSTAFNTLVSWPLPQGRSRKASLRKHAFIVDTAFAPSGRLVATLTEFADVTQLHVWSDELRKKKTIDIAALAPRLAWSADSALIAVIQHEAPGLTLWNPVTLDRSSLKVEEVDLPLAVLAAHPERTAFIAGSDQGALLIWEAS